MLINARGDRAVFCAGVVALCAQEGNRLVKGKRLDCRIDVRREQHRLNRRGVLRAHGGFVRVERGLRPRKVARLYGADRAVVGDRVVGLLKGGGQAPPRGHGIKPVKRALGLSVPLVKDDGVVPRKRVEVGAHVLLVLCARAPHEHHARGGERNAPREVVLLVHRGDQIAPHQADEFPLAHLSAPRIVFLRHDEIARAVRGLLHRLLRAGIEAAGVRRLHVNPPAAHRDRAERMVGRFLPRHGDACRLCEREVQHARGHAVVPPLREHRGDAGLVGLVLREDTLIHERKDALRPLGFGKALERRGADFRLQPAVCGERVRTLRGFRRTQRERQPRANHVIARKRRRGRLIDKGRLKRGEIRLRKEQGRENAGKQRGGDNHGTGFLHGFIRTV